MNENLAGRAQINNLGKVYLPYRIQIICSRFHADGISSQLERLVVIGRSENRSAEAVESELFAFECTRPRVVELRRTI